MLRARRPQLGLRLPVSVSPRKRIVACARPVQRQDHAGQGRLAAAGAADQRRSTARPDREGDVVDGADRAALSNSDSPPAGIDRATTFATSRSGTGAGCSRPGWRAARRDMHRGLRQLARIGMALLRQRARRLACLHHRAAAHDRDRGPPCRRPRQDRARSTAAPCGSRRPGRAAVRGSAPAATTSSAVVGSSAISSFGFSAQAMAMTTRWRWPPDSSCG